MGSNIRRLKGEKRIIKFTPSCLISPFEKERKGYSSDKTLRFQPRAWEFESQGENKKKT